MLCAAGLRHYHLLIKEKRHPTVPLLIDQPWSPTLRTVRDMLRDAIDHRTTFRWFDAPSQHEDMPRPVATTTPGDGKGEVRRNPRRGRGGTFLYVYRYVQKAKCTHGGMRVYIAPAAAKTKNEGDE